MEYHKIETLYERDEKTHRLKQPLVLKNATYSLINLWQFTEKIDGTNIRCIWEPAAEDRPESLRFAGKTDNAQTHPELLRWLAENVKADRLREVFPTSSAVIYGEGYGAGIQKGGIYSPTKKLIVFDVLVDGKWWLSWQNTCDVAEKLGLDVVPYIGESTLAEAAELVRGGFKTKLGNGEAMAEGVVGRTAETLFDKKGARLIVKLKTKDF
jgi:RNA ligase-like protein